MYGRLSHLVAAQWQKGAPNPDDEEGAAAKVRAVQSPHRGGRPELQFNRCCNNFCSSLSDQQQQWERATEAAVAG